MRMQRFKTPPEEFIAEMINSNLAQDKTPIDLSGVPHSVLAKVVHAVLIRGLSDDPAPKVEISVGPDENYHHEVKGLSVLTPSQAQVFYEHEGEWYSVVLVVAGVNELFVMKLLDDATDDWDVLDPNEAAELEVHQQMCVDTLSYLGVLQLV